MRLCFLMAAIVLMVGAGASESASGADGEKSLQGIWIDNADDLTRSRPTALSTEPGTGQVLVTFTRESR